jgi:hypothetical protein
MAKYNILTEGYDPTSDAAAITRSNLLAMIHEAEFAEGVGGVIDATIGTLPNVALYPRLASFIASLSESGVRTGKLRVWNGTSWVPLDFEIGSINGNVLIDGTVDLSKLSLSGGAAKYLLRINSAGDGLEYVPLSTVLENGSVPLAALATAAGQHYLLASDGTGIFTSGTMASKLGAGLKALTPVELFTSISADKIAYVDETSGIIKVMTIRRFFEQLADQLTELTTTNTADRIIIYDESADGGDKTKVVEIGNLLPDVITAGTTTRPESITVNAKGQVTAVVAGSGDTFTKVGPLQSALPTAPGDAGKITFDTNFGAEPSFVDFRLICTSTDATLGYAIGEIISLSAVAFAGGDPDHGYYWRFEGELVHLVQPDTAAANARAPKKDGTSADVFDTTKWQVIFRAIK